MAYTRCKEEWGYETIVESDISGCELNDDDMYYYDGLVMNYEELVEYMIKNKKGLEKYEGNHCCECCEEKPAIYIFNGQFICEECLRDEWLVDYETTKDGYFWELEND